MCDRKVVLCPVPCKVLVFAATKVGGILFDDFWFNVHGVLIFDLYRQAWDLAVDICLSQLPTIIEEGTAFRVSVCKKKFSFSPPAQLKFCSSCT